MFTLALGIAACSGKHSAVQNEEPDQSPAPPSSTVRMNDPAVEQQLVSGFYAVENNAWRWTAGHFSVELAAPPGAAQGGAVLRLELTIPDVIQKLGPVTLTASAGGKTLRSQEFKAAGPQTFTADVPASMITGNTVTFDFVTNKTIGPNAADRRELGVIAGSISLGPRS